MPHLPDVEQKLFAVPRCDVEHRPVGRHRIVDRLAEVPRLWLDRIRQVAAGQLPVGQQRDLDRRRVADRLGEQPDDVVEVGGGAQSAIPPGGIVRARSHRHAGLVFRNEPVVHRRTNQVQTRNDQRVEVVVGRIAERRCEHHRPRRTRLMMVVHDLRKPLDVHRPVHVLRLGLRRHVEIAIVVVADVLLVQSGNA